MFYGYPQRRCEIKVLSGIDMALWDLAEKILHQPVSKLLGGNFRDEILLYSHATGGDYLSKEQWRDRAQKLKSDPRGFKAFKVDIHRDSGSTLDSSVLHTGQRSIWRRDQHRCALSLRTRRAECHQSGPGGGHPPTGYHQLGRYNGREDDRGYGGSLSDPDRATQRKRTHVEYGVAAGDGRGVQLPAHRIQWAAKNPIVIKNGHMKVSTNPSLGVELNQEYLKANRAESEPWWG